ncbi:MAG: hypothetical protein RLZZ371_1367, partial [Pseudomonadota bacterium]
GMFGALLLVVMMAAPGGLVGTIVRRLDVRKQRLKTAVQPAVAEGN